VKAYASDDGKKTELDLCDDSGARIKRLEIVFSFFFSFFLFLFLFICVGTDARDDEGGTVQDLCDDSGPRAVLTKVFRIFYCF